MSLTSNPLRELLTGRFATPLRTWVRSPCYVIDKWKDDHHFAVQRLIQTILAGRVYAGRIQLAATHHLTRRVTRSESLAVWFGD